MERKSLTIQCPNKENIIYFNTDVDMCTVDTFNKEYIEKCRTILADKAVAEEKVNRLINEYNIAYNPLNPAECRASDITLKTPSLYIMMQSPGGSVYNGLSMYDTIKSYNTQVKTNLYISGMCMSMGTILLCSVPLDQRIAHPNTTFMIHQVSSMTFGMLADMEQDVEETKRLNNILFDILIKNTNIPAEKLDEVYREKKDWFISADEAVTYGLISKVSNVPIIY